MHFSDVEVGKRLFVGNGQPKALKTGQDEVRGSAYIEGPLQTGTADAFGSIVATQMIGRDKNEESDDPPRSLWIKGNTFLQGDDGTPFALQLTGNSNITGSTQTGQCINIQSATPTAISINNVTTIDKYGDAIFTIGTSGQTMSSRFSQADGRPKPFDIKHPSKEGYRLRHACIEGPEVGVYFRGRLKNDNIIELPYYWKDLVHIDSISVQLQPIGAHQDIIVKRWDAEKIEVQSKPGIPINCFYHVYAERKDINPLITEYEGESWKDYPDPNYNPEKVHYEDQTFTDPRFAGPPNTVTM